LPRSYGVNRRRIQIDLQIAWVGRAVVEQQYGWVAARKKLLKGEDLPPIPNCVLGKQPELGKRIESGACPHAPEAELKTRKPW
jgi:hypothetical protein